MSKVCVPRWVSVLALTCVMGCAGETSRSPVTLVIVNVADSSRYLQGETGEERLTVAAGDQTFSAFPPDPCRCDQCAACAGLGAPIARVTRLDPGNRIMVVWDGRGWDVKEHGCGGSSCTFAHPVRSAHLRVAVPYAASVRPEPLSGGETLTQPSSEAAAEFGYPPDHPIEIELR